MPSPTVLRQFPDSTDINGSDNVGIQRPIERPLRLGFVGTYPPTQCGIATFTESLVVSMQAVQSGVSPLVIRLRESAAILEPSPAPILDWYHNNPASFQNVIHCLHDVDMVIVQHEYGIFGGKDGSEIVELLQHSPVPSLVVLHTVPQDPTPHQRAILQDVLELSDMCVVQSNSALQRLLREFPGQTLRVVVIPHGAWTTPATTPEHASERPRVLTWGLVGPGKGLEHGIAAMADVVRSVPEAEYVIAGETHPKVREHEGERYRDSLQARVTQLGLENNVTFCDRYMDRLALQHLVESADVVLLPYDSREQVTSGVLVEALAAGQPVVSTAFPHAIEALSTGAGSVVSHGDAHAMATAITRILTQSEIAQPMQREARRIGAQLSWQIVASQYLNVVNQTVHRTAAA